MFASIQFKLSLEVASVISAVGFCLQVFLNVAKLSGVDEDDENQRLPLELYADGKFFSLSSSPCVHSLSSFLSK